MLFVILAIFAGETPAQPKPPTLELDPPPPLSPGLTKTYGQIVHLQQPEAVGSTTVELKWEVRKNQRYIEGRLTFKCLRYQKLLL